MSTAIERARARTRFALDPRLEPWLAGALAAALTAISAHGRWSQYDNYTRLAAALLHGHVWIDWPGPYIDALGFGAQHYVIEAPFPALLLLPFVALFGTANQTLLAIALAGVAIGAAWQFARNLGASLDTRIWMCAFMFAGTDLWWCAMLGDVWFLAGVSATAFTFLALAEVTGKRRGWLVALYGAAAFESRFTLVLALPVYAYLLYEAGDVARLRRRYIGFAAVLAAVAVLWVAYNEARWGLPSDIGYTMWYHQDSAGSPFGSPFQLRYLPYEMWSFFAQLPDFPGKWPYVVPGFGGVALTWTSPALVLAVLARGPARIVLALVALTILTAGPSFIYYVNGYAQFGMRHALDFEPFVFGLMVLGTRARVPVWGKALIAWSCVAGFWGVWFWNYFYRQQS